LNTYKGLNGTLERNEAYWDSLIDAADYGNHEFLINNTNNKFSYIVVKDDKVIELAGDSENVCDILEKCNISEIEISNDHPAFNLILSRISSDFTFRPEPKEGHLIKVYNEKLPVAVNLNNLHTSLYSEKTIFNKDSSFINILYLNQW
jgi:hypothetical protein